MKKLACLLIGAAAIVSVAACADDYYGEGYGHASPYYYDGYYDDFYGPAYGGYWGSDGFFYYQQNGRDRTYIRDDGRHFRRDAATGYHSFHMRDPGDHEHHEHNDGDHHM
jgi:hypothetical protein